MAVSVSRDLTVRVLEDPNTLKLAERQQALKIAIQKGEPKCLGVSQVMLGLMVMSYSIPLLFTEFTEVVALGVPWWSGLMRLSRGVKSSLLVFTLAQTVIAAILCVLLFRQRRSFVSYTPLGEAPPPTSTLLTSPDLN